MFKLVDPQPEPTVLEEWRAGPVSIVCLAYAFGQFRLQCWYQRHPEDRYPEILLPNG